jgi:hypothetical protein
MFFQLIFRAEKTSRPIALTRYNALMSRLRALWRSLYVRRRWLTIGIGVKRWLVLLVAGAAVGIGWVCSWPLTARGWLPGLL